MTKVQVYGVDAIIEIMTEIVKIGEKVDKALDDGHLSWTEGIGLTISTAGAIPVIVKDGKQFMNEVKELSPEEGDQVLNAIAAELKLKKPYVEAKLKAGMKVVVSTSEFFSVKKEDF